MQTRSLGSRGWLPTGQRPPDQASEIRMISIAGGAQTIRHLRVVAGLLECDDLEIANLFAIPTRDVTAINRAGRASDGWEAARSRLRQVITEADHLLAGWGVSGLAGQAAVNRRAQLCYVGECARESGKDYIWTLNGEARHPSRWHQYVSDRHGRASGASLNERMAMVLTSIPFTTLCPESRPRDEVIPCPAPAH
jgi:Protein of unknown function (DUF1643)